MENLSKQNLQITPATIQELIAEATYWRQCAREAYTDPVPRKGVIFSNLTQLAESYAKKAAEAEVLLETFMAFKRERLKEVLPLSTQGKTLSTPAWLPLNLKLQPESPKDNIRVPLVDAQTDIKAAAEKEEEESSKLKLVKKSVDPKKESYVRLEDVPMSEEDKEEILHMWTKTKGDVAKGKLYEKVRDMMNYYDMSIATLRSEISSFVHRKLNAIKQENAESLRKEIEESETKYELEHIDLNNLPSGEVLLSGAMPYTIDGRFNICLLSGTHTVEEINPLDYLKLHTTLLRVAGRDKQAISEIVNFFNSTEEKWNEEKAMVFLNGATRAINHAPITKLVKNILAHKQEKTNDYTKGIENAKNLLKAYSQNEVEVPEHENVEKGKTVKMKTVVRHWSDSKMNNFIDRAIDELVKEGIIKEVISPKKEVIKKVEKTTVTKEGEKPATSATTGSTPTKEKDSVQTQPKGDSKLGTDATTPAQKGIIPPKSKEDKAALKAAKKAAKLAAKIPPTTETVPVQQETASTSEETKTEEPGKQETKSTYSAIIYRNEKTGKYGVYLDNFKEYVHVQNLESDKDAPTALQQALDNYTKKVMESNAKGKKGEKGRVVNFLPKDLADLEVKSVQFMKVNASKVAN